MAKRARKDLMVGLLLADPNGPPPLSLLPPPKSKPPSGGGHGRLEQRVLLIAQQVGVPPAAIAQLTTPAALPPT